MSEATAIRLVIKIDGADTAISEVANIATGIVTAFGAAGPKMAGTMQTAVERILALLAKIGEFGGSNIEAALAAAGLSFAKLAEVRLATMQHLTGSLPTTGTPASGAGTFPNLAHAAAAQQASPQLLQAAQEVAHDRLKTVQEQLAVTATTPLPKPQEPSGEPPAAPLGSGVSPVTPQISQVIQSLVAQAAQQSAQNIAQVSPEVVVPQVQSGSQKLNATDSQLSDIFGIEIQPPTPPQSGASVKKNVEELYQAIAATSAQDAAVVSAAQSAAASQVAASLAAVQHLAGTTGAVPSGGAGVPIVPAVIPAAAAQAVASASPVAPPVPAAAQQLPIVANTAQASSAFNALQAQIAAGGARISQALTSAFSPLRTIRGLIGEIGSAWNTFGDQALRVTGAIYSAEQIGRSLRGVAAPYESVVANTEDSRKFQVGISGVAGGMDRAAAIDSALIAASKDIPLTLQQIRETAVEMTHLASQSSQVSTGSTEEVAKHIADYTTIISRLAAVNPYTDPKQILEAVNGMLEGQVNTRNVRRSLGVDPSELSRIAGVKQTDFTANPELLMNALHGFLDRIAPEGVAGDRGELASVVWGKLQDQLKIAFQRIGDDGGLYDHLRDRLNQVMTQAFSYVTSAQGGERFKSIGESMSSAFDSVGESMLKLVEQITGARDLQDLPDAIGRSIAKITGVISDLAKNLPGIASDVGAGIKTLAESFQGVVKFLSSINTLVKDPAAATGSFVASYVQDKTMRLDPEERKRVQLESIQRVLMDMGVGDTSVQKYVTSTPIMGGQFGTQFDTSYQLAATNAKGNPALAAMTEKLISVAEKMDPDAKNPTGLTRDDLLAAARSAITDFDAKLSLVLGKAGSAAVPEPYKLPPAISAAVSAANREGYIDFNYSTRYRSAEDAASRIAPVAANPLANTFTAANRSLDDLSGKTVVNGKPAEGDDAFTEISKFRDQAVADLQKIIDSLYKELENDPGHMLEIDQAITNLTGAQEKHIEQAKQESDRIAKATAEGTNRLGASLPKELAGAGATDSADMMESWLQGQTDSQQRSARLLNKHGYNLPVGPDALPDESRTTFLNKLTQEKLASIQELGGSPDISKTSAEDLIQQGFNPRSASNSLLGGTGTAQMQLDYVRDTAMPRAQSTFMEAQQSFLSNTDASKADDLKRQMDLAAEAVVGLGQKLNTLGLASNSALRSLVEFGNQVEQTIQTSLGDVFDSLITKTNNLREVLSNFGKSIASDFSQQISHSIVGSIAGDPAKGGGLGNVVSSLLTGQGENLGGVAGWLYSQFNQASPSQVESIAAPAASTAFSIGGDITPAANGAIFRGGFLPFEAFSAGGIARKPTMGVVGEGGADEGIIPLRDGRIPLRKDANGGIHAVLPGNGRSIPTAFFAVGGIAPGGFGGSPSFDAGAASSGGYGGGGGSVNAELHIYNVNSVKEAFEHGYRGMSNQLLNDVLNEGRPGGKLRRVLSKTT